MKRIFYFLCAIALLCTGCEKDTYDITTITKTEVSAQTSTADFIIYVSDQNGNHTDATVEEIGVFLSTYANPTTKDERVSLAIDEDYRNTIYQEYGAFVISVSGFAANTKYYVLPYISNRFGMITGEVVSFTTNGSATVTTKEATNITSSSAQLNGNISSNGGSVTISKRGFLLSLSSNPKIGDSNVDNWETTGRAGEYAVTYNGLSDNTKYYFRAYAIVNDETVYGSVKHFTTSVAEDAITLVLNDPTDITDSSAKVSGKITISSDAKGTISEIGIKYVPSSEATFDRLVYYTSSEISSWTGEHTISGTIYFDSYDSYYYYIYYIKGGQTYSTTSKLVSRRSSTPGSQVSDFVGMYHAKAYLPEHSEYYSWDTVKIYTYTTTNQEEKVCVEGLAGGYSYDVAIGEFNASHKAIQLHKKMYWSNNTFTVTDKGDTLFFSVFFPIYCSTSDWDVIDDIPDGEAWMTFDSNGKVVLGPSNTPDSYGKYANGYTFAWYYAEDNKYFSIDYLYTQLELTKFSSTVYAPKKVRNNQEWHAPMLRPDLRRGRTANNRMRRN